MSPFKALYGRDPPTLLRYTEVHSIVEDINRQMVERSALLDELKSNLLAAQDHMRTVANARSKDVSFLPGDFVHLKLQPYRLKSFINKINDKLNPRFYGPFQVLAKVGEVAYKLALPSSARIHHVFHISQLKKSLHHTTPVQPLPTGLNEEMELWCNLPQFILYAPC